MARIGLQLLTVLVLARLLTPRDYGLVALALVVVGVGEIFRDFGLSTAAVRAAALSAEQRSNLFWLNTALGFLLAVVVLVGAPLVAAVFDEPALAPVTRVLALTFVVNGLSTQYRADLNRRMKFGALALSDVTGQAVGFVAAVACAALGAGYWSLVAQQLSQLTTVLLLLVWSAGWLPTRPSRAADVRPIVRLGTSLATTQLIYYVSNNLDTFTIGLRFGSSSLGLYNRAFSLLMSPLSQVRAPATTVALPVLSRLGDDVRQAGAYLKRAQLVLGYTVVAALAVAAGAAVPLVGLLLGPRWSGVAPILTCLAVAGACSTLSYVGLWVYLSRGLGRQLMRYTLLTLVLQAVFIVGGSTWGVVGVAAGYMVAAVVEWPLSLLWLSRLTVLPVRDLLLAAVRITAVASVVGVTARIVASRLSSHSDALSVLVATAASLAAYVLVATAVPPIRDDIRAVVDVSRRMLQR